MGQGRAQIANYCNKSLWKYIKNFITLCYICMPQNKILKSLYILAILLSHSLLALDVLKWTQYVHHLSSWEWMFLNTFAIFFILYSLLLLVELLIKLFKKAGVAFLFFFSLVETASMLVFPIQTYEGTVRWKFFVSISTKQRNI